MRSASLRALTAVCGVRGAGRSRHDRWSPQTSVQPMKSVGLATATHHFITSSMVHVYHFFIVIHVILSLFLLFLIKHKFEVCFVMHYT